jgi:hypothetical protein
MGVSNVRYGRMAAGEYLRERFGFEYPADVPDSLLGLTDLIHSMADDVRRDRERLERAILDLRRNFTLMDNGFGSGGSIWYPLGESAADLHPYTWARRIGEQEERLALLLAEYKTLAGVTWA